MTARPILDIAELRVSFEVAGRRLAAVRGLTFAVAAGEVVGLVGESGSGKSVAMMSVMRLVDETTASIEADRLAVDGRDMRTLDRRTLEDWRGRAVSYIFQDPLTALNPVLTVGYQIVEVLRRHGGLDAVAARAAADDLLVAVGIPSARLRSRQFPHQFSGGMRQRIMIAMALAARPRLLVADEPTTALDVTVQAEIVSLVKSLQAATGMGMVWVTHDLALLARLAHRVVVMYAGAVVEDAPADAIYRAPAHPYTAGLLASTSRMDVALADQEPIPGAPPSPFETLPGCAFAPRCGRAGARCRSEPPALETFGDRRVACFHPLAVNDDVA